MVSLGHYSRFIRITPNNTIFFQCFLHTTAYSIACRKNLALFFCDEIPYWINVLKSHGRMRRFQMVTTATDSRDVFTKFAGQSSHLNNNVQGNRSSSSVCSRSHHRRCTSLHNKKIHYDTTITSLPTTLYVSNFSKRCSCRRGHVRRSTSIEFC